MKGRGKREILEKTRRPAASFDTIPAYENSGATLSGIEPVSHGWEASSLATTSPRPSWLKFIILRNSLPTKYVSRFHVRQVRKGRIFCIMRLPKETTFQKVAETDTHPGHDGKSSRRLALGRRVERHWRAVVPQGTAPDHPPDENSVSLPLPASGRPTPPPSSLPTLSLSRPCPACQTVIRVAGQRSSGGPGGELRPTADTIRVRPTSPSIQG
ncbi:hypothetical protein PR048_027866 [Dryococelus australis]|uniref:Uncharacterized protein n=1 Tax=Dryococelus australis TaxID=614101 RepID=A0ABQ9GHR4_9NEOP|nr:hypothetical protein PR048_027866 [Dryococelus australis]